MVVQPESVTCRCHHQAACLAWPKLIVRVALAIVLAQPLTAQSRDTVSLEITVGASRGWGGGRNYIGEGGVAGEITLGIRARPGDATTRITAVTVGARSSFNFTDVCVMDTVAGFGCRPRFPSVAHIGLLGGLERRRRAGALRVLAGPAFYGGKDASGLGAQLQLDAAVGFTHLALLLAARGSFILRPTGETLGLGSLGLGLRVQ